MHTFMLSTKIVSGENALNVLESLGMNRVYVVSDSTMVKIGVLKKVTQMLENLCIKYEIFDSVEANPSLQTVQNGLMEIINYKPDALIALGGGSVIDAAKAMVFFCIKTKKELIGQSDIKKPFFIAIPTTSGTGSEVTSFSVITDHEAQRKIPLSDEKMLPDLAVLDASFTLSVPPIVSADTGMDVITHALEAYVSKDRNVFSDVYAIKALDLAFCNILKVFYNGNNLVARQSMHDASCMAGVAFTNAGLGINHSLAHVVGGRFKISHGRANAILLPHVIKYNSGLSDGQESVWGNMYDKLSKHLGLNLDSRLERIKGLVTLIQYYNDKLEIPVSFKSYGLDEEDFLNAINDMSHLALEDICTLSNPRKVGAEELKEILINSFYGCGF